MYRCRFFQKPHFECIAKCLDGKRGKIHHQLRHPGSPGGFFFLPLHKHSGGPSVMYWRSHTNTAALPPLRAASILVFFYNIAISRVHTEKGSTSDRSLYCVYTLDRGVEGRRRGRARERARGFSQQHLKPPGRQAGRQ